MSSRLAMVSCREGHDGPWTIAKGNESKLEIFGLGHGEKVKLELLKGDLPYITASFERSGLFEWPEPEASRYRVCKVVGVDSPKLPTTVRILLNGKH